MTSLVDTTLQAMTHPGMQRGDAARELVQGINLDLGTRYDTLRLGQWKRAERAIPQRVQDWMLRTCIAQPSPLTPDRLQQVARIARGRRRLHRSAPRAKVTLRLSQ